MFFSRGELNTFEKGRFRSISIAFTLTNRLSKLLGILFEIRSIAQRERSTSPLKSCCRYHLRRDPIRRWRNSFGEILLRREVRLIRMKKPTCDSITHNQMFPSKTLSLSIRNGRHWIVKENPSFYLLIEPRKPQSKCISLVFSYQRH